MADAFYGAPVLKARKGYRWVRGTLRQVQDKRDPLYLAPIVKPGEDSLVVKQCGPFQQQTALFKKFAETEISCPGILAFADQFGDLREPPVFMQTPPKKAARARKRVHFEKWREEIVAMRAAVLLWELIRKEDEGLLSRHVKYLDNPGAQPCIHFDSHPHLRPGKLPDEPDCRLTEDMPLRADTAAMQAHIKASAPVLPAYLYLQWLINQRLGKLVEPTMLWDAEKGRIGLHVVPNCLLGGLWLQFAEAVSRTKKFRNCDECGSWFEVSPQAARTNRRFCGDKCKTKNSRQGKKIRKLHAQGWPIEKIAKETGYDVATVRKRLSPKKKEKSDGKKAKGQG